MKIIKLRKVDSTNEYLKRLNYPGAVAVVAKRQTAGKGTKGRSFSSDKGGLYISLMSSPENISAEGAFSIMVNCCVAVCKTLDSLGLKPIIRWANDVLVGGKKICGTLIENTLSAGSVSRTLVGMGININNALPEGLKDSATSVKEQTGKRHSVKRVCNILLSNLKNSYTVADYKGYIDWLGKDVILKRSDGETAAKALDISDDGRLVCLIGRQIEKISSAEVSLRL